MIEANIGLITKHMGRRNADFTKSEIISLGLPGLIRAIETYDPAKGTKFSTHAEWQIKGPLWRAIAKERQARCLPSPLVKCAAPEPEPEMDLSGVLHLLNVPQQIFVSLVQRGLPQKDIAKVLNVSEMRVSQIKQEIVAKLRPHCCSEE